MHASKAYLMRQKTKENSATMPHKPRLHALGPIVFCVSAIYEYGVLDSYFPVKTGKTSAKYLSAGNANHRTF